jgi:hypothetical protein
MSDAERLEAEAAEIIKRTILELPAGRENGSAERLVRCLVDAALARLKDELVAARAKQKGK